MIESAMARPLDDAASTPEQPRPVLAMRGVSKRFGATQALEDVSLALFRGEVHALLGENGAGKSTLIKILTGIQQQDTGEVLIDGAPVQVASSQDAQRLGVAAMYQEPMIFPDLSVAENIFIGHRNRGRLVDRRRMEREANEVLARLDVRFDAQADRRTRRLSVVGAHGGVPVVSRPQPTSGHSALGFELWARRRRAFRYPAPSPLPPTMGEGFQADRRRSDFGDGD